MFKYKSIIAILIIVIVSIISLIILPYLSCVHKELLFALIALTFGFMIGVAMFSDSEYMLVGLTILTPTIIINAFLLMFTHEEVVKTYIIHNTQIVSNQLCGIDDSNKLHCVNLNSNTQFTRIKYKLEYDKNATSEFVTYNVVLPCGSIVKQRTKFKGFVNVK